MASPKPPLLHQADGARSRPPRPHAVPDLPALLAKLRMMQKQESDELEILGRSVLEVLVE